MKLLPAYLWLAAKNAFQASKAPRIPEPDLVTTAEESVRQYQQALETKLAVLYDLSFDYIVRARPALGGKAVDLGCGPGLFTIGLAQALDFETVVGVDLSPEMIAAAQNIARSKGLEPRVKFQQGDITCLEDFESSSFDVVCSMGVMHHLPDLDFVARAFEEAQRVAKPSGLIFVLEYVRFNTEQIIDDYAKVTGADLLEDDLPNLYVDYRNSLHAAWTASELRSCVPRHSKHRWLHVVPRILPPLQLLIGIPQSQENLLIRNGLPKNEMPFSGYKKYPLDWKVMSNLLKTAKKEEIP